MGSSGHQIYCNNIHVHLFRPIYTSFNHTSVPTQQHNHASASTQKSPSLKIPHIALPPPRPALRAASPHHQAPQPKLQSDLIPNSSHPSHPTQAHCPSLQPSALLPIHPNPPNPSNHQLISHSAYLISTHYLNHPTTHVLTRRVLPKTRQDPPRPSQDQSRLSPNQYRAPNPTPPNEPAGEPLVSYGACQGPCAGRAFSSKRHTSVLTSQLVGRAAARVC